MKRKVEVELTIHPDGGVSIDDIKNLPGPSCTKLCRALEGELGEADEGTRRKTRSYEVATTAQSKVKASAG